MIWPAYFFEVIRINTESAVAGMVKFRDLAPLYQALYVSVGQDCASTNRKISVASTAWTRPEPAATFRLESNTVDYVLRYLTQHR